MSYVEETAVRSTVIIHVQDGDVVVKGRDEGDVRVVGQAQTSTENGNTIIKARGSVVVEVPRTRNVEIDGGIQDVALKNVANVKLNEVQGDLAANDVDNLTVGNIFGDGAVRGLRGDLVVADVHGSLQVKEARTVNAGTVHGHAEFRSVDSLQIEEVNGHLKVKGARMVAGDQVNGHAVFKDVEQVSLNQVNGHIEAKGVQDVTVEHVNGHAELKEVRGAVRIENVEGNLEIKSIGTSLAVEEVQGDVVIRGAWHRGGEYTFAAQGDVEIKAEGSAHFIFKNEGELATGEGCEVQEESDGTTHVYVGEREGAATITFESEGDVTINLPDHEHDHRHHRHHRRHRDWNREWHGEFEWDWEKHGPEVEQEVQRAMKEVRVEMQRAKETVRHELEKAMREVDIHARGPVGGVIRNAMRDLMNSLRDKSGTTTVEEPVAETPVNDPSEEVKMILQMIADGKITPEQGEQLLQAMSDK